MNQFHWQGSQPSNKGAAQLSSTSNAGGLDLPGLKINTAQVYSAKIQAMPQTPSQVQIQINVPQANGQPITLSQPLPQLPQGIALNQSVQVTLTMSQSGQLTLTINPTAKNPNQQGKTPSADSTSNPNPKTSQATNQLAVATNTSAQTLKLSLSDQQIVALLTLNKAYQQTKTGTIQTQAQITQSQMTQSQMTQSKDQQPQLKLQGLSTPIKLPANIANLLQNHKSAAITLKSQDRDIQLQIELPTGGKVATTLTAEKLTPIIKHALTQTANQSVLIDKQASGDKITLANQQSLNITGKLAALPTGEAQIKLTQLSASQLTVQISSKSQPTTHIKIDIPATQINANIKQALQLSANLDASNAIDNQSKTQSKNLSTNQSIENGKIVTTTLQASTAKTNSADKINDKSNESQAITTQNVIAPKTQPDLSAQKQALQQFIDPLVRLLLPKKLNWNEGFKTLTTLEQLSNLPPKTDLQGKSTPVGANPSNTSNINQTNTPPPIELKQLLNHIKEAIPDHNAQLDLQTISKMVTDILNFSPTKSVAPSAQPTPANAIASAIQLLLGAKITQTDSKLSPQLQQQLQQLVKPLSTQTPNTEAGLKNITQGLNQASSEGSLKALTGIQSTIRHQQVENVEKRLDGNHQLELTLPLRIDNQVKELHIAINEEKHKSETSANRLSIWNLTLTFDLNELGKLLANAKLKDGEVSIHLYAEQPKTLALMNKFSATLEQRLEFHGVKINQIQSSLGKINPTNSKRQLNSLLQIKV